MPRLCAGDASAACAGDAGDASAAYVFAEDVSLADLNEKKNIYIYIQIIYIYIYIYIYIKPLLAAD
jgi:hypothetical protein